MAAHTYRKNPTTSYFPFVFFILSFFSLQNRLCGPDFASEIREVDEFAWGGQSSVCQELQRKGVIMFVEEWQMDISNLSYSKYKENERKTTSLIITSTFRLSHMLLKLWLNIQNITEALH